MIAGQRFPSAQRVARIAARKSRPAPICSARRRSGDTGSSSAFNLTPEAVALLKLEDQAQPSENTSVGYNGESESKQGILKSVRLGRISVESVQANFLLPKTGHDNLKFQVSIGNGFFQDFVMTFDFKNKLVVFERVD